MSDSVAVELSSEQFFKQWVLATFGGWVLGIPVLLVLSGLGDLIHLGGQFYVGVGMGLGVGFAQWRVARKWFGAGNEWMWGCAAGIGLPYVVADALRVSFEGDTAVLLLLLTAAGGLLAGLWQLRTVKHARANWWVAASVLGWAVAAALPPLLVVGGHPDTGTALIRNIGGILLGGVALGLITGGALMWVLRSEPTPF